MKTTIFVFLAIVAMVCADEWKMKTADEIKTIRKECLEEFPLTAENMNKMKNFEYPDEESVRNYLLCTSKKIGIFCSHEGYHADRLAKQFKMDMDEEEVLQIATGCIDNNEQGSPVDVWAFRGHNCLMSSKIGDRVKAYIQKKMEEAKKSA